MKSARSGRQPLKDFSASFLRISEKAADAAASVFIFRLWPNSHVRRASTSAMASAASPKRRQQHSAAASGGGRAPRGTAQVVTAEQYRAACAVLRPDTMRDACRLLLGSYSKPGSGQGSPNGGDNGAGDKLLGMYRRVKSAADVIGRKEQSNAGGGGGGMHGKRGLDYPSTSPGGMGGTPAGVGGGQKQQVPRARSSMAAVAAAAKAAGSAKGAPHSQQRKGSLTGGHGHGVGGPPAKRQRMMHQHQQQHAHGHAHADEGDAPPEAALSFLKALNQAKPATATISSVTPPPPAPPLHGPGSKAKGGSTGQAKSSTTTSSTAFPGARAGRSQPRPVGTGRSRPSASSGSSKKNSGGAPTAGRTASSRASRAASSSAATSASSSSFKPKEVGEDVLVKWTDGNKYAAIIKDVDVLDVGEDGAAGGVVYEVEFDNGEIERVKATDVLSQSDLEDEDEYE